MHSVMVLETQMPEWSEIMIMFETAAKLLGIGAVFVAAILWIVKTLKNLKAPQKSLEERMDAFEVHQDKDLRRFEQQEEINKQNNEVNSLVLQAIMAMQAHMLDGNHTKDLEVSRAEIHNYLLKRK